MMQSSSLASLLEPTVLFFLLGIALGLMRSPLEIPAQVAKFLSMYLLVAIGFKGGQAIAAGGFGAEGVYLILAAVLLALAIPAWSFVILRRKVPPLDAAAVAATYGSVSAVTFVAATQFVTSQGDQVSGAMTVALVLMESPAIVMAVVLATWVRSQSSGPDMSGGQRPADDPRSVRTVVREAFTDGPILLLVGSLVIGAVSGSKGGEAMAPFVGGLFKGLLAFFLLEMGLLVGRRLRETRDLTAFLIGFALIMPVVNASVAIGLARLIGASGGNAIILAVLAASASYIVVPAVVRSAIPEARPGVYFTMALGVTFPFNIIVGIPLYAAMVDWLWR